MLDNNPTKHPLVMQNRSLDSFLIHQTSSCFNLPKQNKYSSSLYFEKSNKSSDFSTFTHNLIQLVVTAVYFNIRKYILKVCRIAY